MAARAPRAGRLVGADPAAGRRGPRREVPLMKLRPYRWPSLVRPDLERLEQRALMNVDFRLAFSIAGAASYTTVRSVAADAAGNLYTAGQFYGTAGFGGTGPSSTMTPQGRSDGFLAKYSPQGRLAWVLDA